jgi:hypothetical protein
MAALFSLVPLPVAGQGFGISIKGGTSGLGGDVAFSFNPKVGVRAGLGLLPATRTVEETDGTYEASPPSPQVFAVTDWFPMASSFRISGGILVLTDVELNGELFGQEIDGEVALSRLQPYVGVGLGNLTTSGVGFVLDLGVAFGSKPDVSLTGPPGFEEELAREEADLEDAFSVFRFMPVLSLGLSYGIGGRG